jgi:hypothetical protein
MAFPCVALECFEQFTVQAFCERVAQEGAELRTAQVV